MQSQQKTKPCPNTFSLVTRIVFSLYVTNSYPTMGIRERERKRERERERERERKKRDRERREREKRGGNSLKLICGCLDGLKALIQSESVEFLWCCHDGGDLVGVYLPRDKIHFTRINTPVA